MVINITAWAGTEAVDHQFTACWEYLYIYDCVCARARVCVRAQHTVALQANLKVIMDTCWYFLSCKLTFCYNSFLSVLYWYFISSTCLISE
jgi:hypothetical protein